MVPLGRHALAHFTDGVKISEVHGTVLRERGRTLFPMYHPAAALRSTAVRDGRVRGRAGARGGASERDDGAHQRALAGRAGDAQ